MISRRTFLKTAALSTGTYITKPVIINSSTVKRTTGYFSVHPFIEQHPEAVFIMRTHVDVKTNTEANRRVGETFARSVLVPQDKSGIPVTRRIAIKPNITGGGGNSLETMGIITDPYFVEGIIDGMRPLGFSSDQFSVREVNSKSWDGHVYQKMARHAGVDFRAMNGRVPNIPNDKMPRWTQNVETISENDLVWVDIPDGVVHRRLPYLWPINAPDTWLLNIAKFKTHSKGLTLCCKNFQGAVANGYQNFCNISGNIKIFPQKHVNPQVENDLNASLRRHVADGIPRWDTERSQDQELWAARTLDNLSATTFGLHVVEGIYGHDGHFSRGPNPPGNEDNAKGAAWDYMSNILIFGMDPFRIDIIGHWLGGHEPGNFGFFHIARERNMSTVLNPSHIPVYLWEHDRVYLKPLNSFERTPLRTNYLQRVSEPDREPLWHMCDEPFDYSSVPDEKLKYPAKAGFRVLTKTTPTSEYPLVTMEYYLPEKGHAWLELIDDSDETREVFVNALNERGFHMASLNTDRYASGNYEVRFRFKDVDETKQIELRK